MKFRVIARRLLLPLALLAAVAAAPAQTLRWANQGDSLTMDPHAQNEALTNSINQQTYERLVGRDRHLAIVPALALSWSQPQPLVWRFKLRPHVKFHDGTPFTADDVLFSVQRAREPTSLISTYVAALGEPVKLDALTVEFRLKTVNPVFLEHLDTLFIMSRAWCEQHRTLKPLDFKNREETHASTHANGTGPFMLVSRAPGIKTVHRRNPAWWGWGTVAEGNVQEVVFTPVANDATRLAALVSGELDLVHDPAPRDVARLRGVSGIKVVEGPENRIVFLAMDQGRDKLLHARVPGERNPFKDLRVRRALYQAIDTEALRSKLMNGLSAPTGSMTPSAIASFHDPVLEARTPFDLAAARRLMAEAGYGEGFEVTLDCPNNRYINDEEICLAVAAMWAQLKVRVKVNAMPRALYFPKVEKMDVSLFMYGWGGAITDAETTLTPLMRNRGDKGVGLYNFSNVRNERFDALAAQSSVEAEPKKREQLIKAALLEWKEQFHTLPLHRQVIPWAMRSPVDAVHRADNYLAVEWVTLRARP
ncbi:ABC transporter substrate-binding protein [Aquabacterium sp. OR-4]|uniref:ABC transporter substrate-binding protein n=1 Tax=Aquabacterium sp. OR-4 TaxID=2978127 RepID=UPI0028C665E9|nr:ABC transporter substrate-binding protein [Aquabacterium sp. OR-4]MDT7835810.1 ABC transporter substrate-binding protein [Aquabacterium sp. OR-4]